MRVLSKSGLLDFARFSFPRTYVDVDASTARLSGLGCLRSCLIARPMQDEKPFVKSSSARRGRR